MFWWKRSKEETLPPPTPTFSWEEVKDYWTRERCGHCGSKRLKQVDCGSNCNKQIKAEHPKHTHMNCQTCKRGIIWWNDGED